MLLCIQYPFADARRFLDPIERLETPTWPLPTPDAEFVRFFGAIRNRPRGGFDGWIGEDPICEANRALSFSRAPIVIEGQKQVRIAFRRLYFDGWAVGKYEIGLAIRVIKSPAKFMGIAIRVIKSPARFMDLENCLLRLPVYTRDHTGSLTRSFIKSELAQAGKHIAQSYLSATTPTEKSILDKDRWQVRSGTPLFYLEISNTEYIKVPQNAKPIKLPKDLADLKLFYYDIPYRGGKRPMWIVQHGLSLEEQDMARTLRIHLLRLNAEHEGLRLILQSLANKDIEITRDTPISNDLQWYLDKALKRITQAEDKTSEVNGEIADIARQSTNVIRPGQIDLLLENVNDYRKYLRQSIEKFAIKDAQTVNFNYTEVHKMDSVQGNQYNFSNFHAGILNIESTLTNVSQAVGSIPNLDQSAKDELKQLVDQLNLALQKAPADKIDDAAKVAKTTKRLVEDISEEKPDKDMVEVTLDGLKKAAENIAKVLPDVLPIALKIIQFAATVVAL